MITDDALFVTQYYFYIYEQIINTLNFSSFLSSEGSDTLGNRS